MTRTTLWIVMLTLAVPAAGAAQERLSLDEAVARARSRHPSAVGAGIAEREAALKVDQARAALYPRVDATESWQRGNLPVFAFSSLLSQRRFTAQDFNLSTLNNPDPLDNFRAALSVEQVIFDGAVGPSIRAAELGREAAALRRQQTEQELATQTVDTYGRILLFEALANAARAGVDAATEDARRARDRYEVGTATQADVLSIDVHAAAMRERDIQARTEAAIARARLNDLIGAPLDALFVLDSIQPILAARRACARARSPGPRRAARHPPLDRRAAHRRGRSSTPPDPRSSPKSPSAAGGSGTAARSAAAKAAGWWAPKSVSTCFADSPIAPASRAPKPHSSGTARSGCG